MVSTRSPPTPIGKTQQRQIELVLVPIMAFLLHSGLNESMVRLACDLAIQKAKRMKSGPKVIHVGQTLGCSEVVARWLRDPTYLNDAGQPRSLPLQGPQSIASLTKECELQVSPSAMLNLLLKFRTVQRLAGRKYILVKKYLSLAGANALSFESSMLSMSDAVKAATRGMGLDPKHRRCFFKRADNWNIPKKYEREFSRFAEQRTMTFLHEIDDWLEQHSQLSSPRTSVVKPRSTARLGLAIFEISSRQE